MRIKTPLKKWAKACFMDATIISGLVVASADGWPKMLSIMVFFTWVSSICTIVAWIAVTFSPKRDKVEELWTKDFIDGLAVSEPFVTYDILTDFLLTAVLVAIGYPVLASIRLFSGVVKQFIVREAIERKLKQLEQ